MPPKTQKPKYVKKDPISHILSRSDMYVGSTRSRDIDEYVVTDSDYHINRKTVSVSPAILRIFIEPLANIIDNVARSKQGKNKVTKISIEIDEETGKTSLWNDGEVIPVELHEDEKCYNHTMIFGHLLTSSNYDDEEDREDISGRNGLGVKLSNVFSKEFIVEGADPENGKQFKQIWKNNMRDTSEPSITSYKKAKGYTKITFTPDFAQFGLEGYTEDVLSLYRRFVVDAAMITKVPVFLNDEEIPVSTLADYAKLYSNNEKETLTIKTKDCEVVVTPSEHEFQAISFANGVCTPLGGTHVDAWSEAIFRPLVEKLNKPKKPQVNIGEVKKYFRLFVVATVKKPEFDSQSKTKLEAPTIEAEVKKTQIATICKWSIMEMLEDIIRAKEMVVLKKAERKKRGHERVEGLDPANNEGGAKGHECTLILVEGLSAKTYASCGIQRGAFGKKGRDWFGIYALRGKCLNCRNAKPLTISKNNVVTDIIKALGIQYGVDYSVDENYKKLRYGRVMIVTDADSVTADTPLLLQNEKGSIIIRNIDSIGEKWMTGDNGKEYATTDLSIWTENGWTRIKNVIRHKVQKKIYRVLTHTGLVDVTEDHSLLDQDGEEISPKDIHIGSKLLHSFPVLNGNKTENLQQMTVLELHQVASKLGIQYYQKYAKEKLLTAIENEYKKFINVNETPYIPEDESFVQGLFWADGSCGVYEWKYAKKPKNRPKTYIFNRVSCSWAISNNDLQLLSRTKAVMEKYYPEYNFSIIENRSNEKKGYSKNYKLILNGGKKVENFVRKWRSDFYNSDKNKKVPDFIMNSTMEIRKNFFEGVLAGDGRHSHPEETQTISILGKIATQGIFYIAKSLGYRVSVNCREDKPNIFTLTIAKNHQCRISNSVKKIIDLGCTEQYVYDLETENHHFQAGIGEMIVHNTDGLHISALLQNMFHALFPTLLRRDPPFVTAMQTPIVRVYQGKTDKLFYDEQEYRRYVRENQGKKINKKYYKGLGSSNEEDVMETFGQKLVEFEEDEKTFESMNKVFHLKYSDMRKDWLETYDPNRVVLKWDGNKPEKKTITYTDYINTELIKFSLDDCKRSIPSLMDGLKEGHRKVLYVTFIRKLKYTGKTIKVAQLAGSVSEKAGYHHGEKNLEATMTGMANAYVGSNNIPLLFRDGQFGSRQEGGKDAAAGRYIWTKLDAMTRLIFREEDDVLLDHIEDDGDKVEPKFYVPIIPMILVNGCAAGIGTGWSSSVPCYNPEDLVCAIKAWLENGNRAFDTQDDITISLLPELKPWYRQHTGEMVSEGDGKFTSWGRVEKDDKGKSHVTELPVGMWTSDFVESLEKLREEKKISTYKNHSTPKDISFVITESSDGITCNANNLKLHKPIRTSNMVLFTEEGTLKKFASPEEIIDNFCRIRYNFYVKRKAKQVKDLELEIKMLGNKKRFLQEVRDGVIKLFDEIKGKRQSRKTADIVEELEERGYDKDNENDKNTDEEEKEDEEETEKKTTKSSSHGYEYLLRLQISSITAEKINKLQNDIANRESQYEELVATTEKDLWIRDLDEFSTAYTKWLPVINSEKQKKGKKKGE